MDAFISYRRETGLDKARSIATELKRQEYSVFFDCDSLVEGLFNQKIYKNIENSHNFILVLSEGCLNRCSDENDWVRLEVEHALKLKKNIIPVLCDGFTTPENMVESIAQVMIIQGVTYNAVRFEQSVGDIINRLRDENGEKILISRRSNVANVYYAKNGMSGEEQKRIDADYRATHAVEEEIFDTFLKDREKVVVFNPAIYKSDVVFKRYAKHEQIAQVFGLMNREEDAQEANRQMEDPSVHFTGKIYAGNMEYTDFEEQMDRILSENDLNGFDIIDLSLILRDLSDPQTKLQQAVDRLNEGGVVYVREIDHDMVLAYPDPQQLVAKMMQFIKRDDYSGDYLAGRKVYNMLKRAGIEEVHVVPAMLSTADLSTKQRKDLMETYFSYVAREYASLLEGDPDNAYYASAIDWIKLHYEELGEMFRHPEFYFLSGFMFFYGRADD